MYKSQHYQKCEKANRPGADFPDLSRDRIFQRPAPSGFKGTIRGELAVREGRNEDKWSKVQPFNRNFDTFPEDSVLRTSVFGKSLKVPNLWLNFLHRKPNMELDQSLFQDSRIGPGRLWSLRSGFTILPSK